MSRAGPSCVSPENHAMRISIVRWRARTGDKFGAGHRAGSMGTERIAEMSGTASVGSNPRSTNRFAMRSTRLSGGALSNPSRSLISSDIGWRAVAVAIGVQCPTTTSVRLIGNLASDHLDQPRFADARLSA